jgi:hypothetical protein
MSGTATFRFESPTAVERAAPELRAAGYEAEPDPNNGALGIAVEFDATDAETEVAVGASVELGSDFDRLERVVARLGGELDTWQIPRLEQIVRLDPPTD